MAHRGGGKRQQRRYRAYLKGKIEITAALGTLGAKKALTAINPGVLDESAWLSSVRVSWSLTDFTAAAGDGPIYVGINHSDYSAAEVEEWIENSMSWTRGDKIAQEIGRRKIRQVGVFETPQDVLDAVHLNDGKPITTKCNWMLLTGQTVEIWCYNSGVSLLTTGSAVIALGHANLWPSA